MTTNEQNDFNQELETLLKTDTSSYKDENEINDRTKKILTSYQSLLEKYMPLEKLSEKRKKSLQKPWITRGIQKSIKIRDKLRNKINKTKSESLYKKYKQYKNLITRLKKNSFNNYYKNKFKMYFKDRKKGLGNDKRNHKL